MSESDPGCVKTCAHEKRAELFSLLSCPGNRRQRFCFSNRLKSRRNFRSQIRFRSFHAAKVNSGSDRPKAEHGAEWQAAMRALLLVAEHDGPAMFARIGVIRALNRHVERVFNPSRKEPHWGRRKLARDR